MKIKNRKKNDRRAFFNLPPEKYRALPKTLRKSNIGENDYLTLRDGTFCRVAKGWHGKDDAWLVVAYAINGVPRERDIELHDIACVELPPDS